jgi:hypothetical protein
MALVSVLFFIMLGLDFSFLSDSRHHRWSFAIKPAEPQKNPLCAEAMCTRCANTCAAALAAAVDNAARNIVRNCTNTSFYSEAILSDSLNHMITELMPEHILHCTKRYLCCRCRKPADMKVRTFHNHLSNMILNKLPWLPPFGNNQKLANNKVVNILLFATPNSWQVEMEKQNWVPMDHTLSEVVKVHGMP